MTKTTKVLWGIICSLAILVLVASIVIYEKAPTYLKNYLVQRFESACDTCELNIENIQIHYLFGPIVFNNVRLQVGRPSITKYDASASKVTSHVNLFSLINSELNFRKIEVDAPVVIITDGDGHSPKKDNNEEERKLKSFAVDEIKVNRGAFSYIRVIKGQSAKLQVHDINGKVGAFGTLPGYLEKNTEADMRARLEKSGSVDIHIATEVFSKPLKVFIALAIKEQNLADINPYFDSNDGISLDGKLLEGTGKVWVTGRTLKSEVWAKYEGLKVSFKQTRDRSSLVAFFMRIGGNLFMDPSNKDEKRFQQTEVIEHKRGERDSLVKFILTGLKLGALNIARDTEGRREVQKKPKARAR